MSPARARKWLWRILLALVALQAYFVRELLAALILFSALFVAVAAVVGIFFLLREAGQRTLAWAEAGLRSLAPLAGPLAALQKLSNKLTRST